MIDPNSEVPIYRQLVDLIRQEILGGAPPPGDKLMSETQMVARYGVSRVTVRQAVRELRTLGLVVTKQGRGTYVRDAPAARHLSSYRYLRQQGALTGVPVPAWTDPAGSGDPRPAGTHEPGQGGPDRAAALDQFAIDHDLPPAGYSVQAEISEIGSPERVAGVLGVPAGQPVLRRRTVIRLLGAGAMGRAEQLTVTYLPSDLARGTRFADPVSGVWRDGLLGILTELGRPVARVDESVSARMPGPDESRLLGLAAGVPVLLVSRRLFADPAARRPLPVLVETVAPADRTALDFVSMLPGPDPAGPQ
jgi:GntR family transcriptional regulator